MLGDLDSLALTVRGMDPKWRLGAGAPHAPIPRLCISTLQRSPGRPCTKDCARDAIRSGAAIASDPDLAGVIGRRDRAWLTSYISDPEKMRAQTGPGRP